MIIRKKQKKIIEKVNFMLLYEWYKMVSLDELF